MQHNECRGFKAAGVACGIKKNGKRDLGLIFSEVPAAAAGVFTRNRVQAAPVKVSRQRIGSGRSQALVVNSGNANCLTGARGMADAQRMAGCVADALDIAAESVLVASTGVIGQPLPIGRIASAAPALAGALAPDGFGDLARAIMTTDTVPKLSARRGRIGGRAFTVLGVAKGSGMICPDMATMLCFVCTDCGLQPRALQKALQLAVQGSFNAMTVDGDTSTNDTTLIMANGLSGACVESAAHEDYFQQMLDDLLLELARKLIRDGEGATKLIEVRVSGAASKHDARRVAGTIANSPLVKTACFGEDANWGRILAAAGRAGVPFDPEKARVAFDNVVLYDDGAWKGPDAEAAAAGVLKQPAFRLEVDLRQGGFESIVLTCDFSLDYVRINADYRS